MTDSALLIGTQATIASLASQLRAVGRAVPAAALSLDGVPAGHPLIRGSLEALPGLHSAAPYSMAIVSLPASMSGEILRVRSLLASLGISERFVTPLDEALARPAATGPLDLVDLLGRTPYGVDRRSVSRALRGRRVLITGAGGSIGSEICRIVATFAPEQVILMERAENALFEIDRQIARRFPELKRRALLHDVADEGATRRVVAGLRPHVVFHAAAHKHVPLMEDHPAHAVTNNVFGTKSIADAALAAGAERFVLISSDKAVNPTSVMGATKRLAEMYVQGLQRRARAEGARARFSMVRFGNVLGSACSVLPIWSSQIAEGGPLTVTDPRMTRYFMTIHEAATLVIQAAALEGEGDGAGLFVLDMGEPVRILDLARRFVAAHGFLVRVEGEAAPEGDSPAMSIAITGARPGEKLHEELAYAAEQLRPTACPGINAWAGPLHESFNLEGMIADLDRARRSEEKETVVAAIRAHVPEMRPASAAAERRRAA